MDYKKTFTAIGVALALGGVVLVATPESAPEEEEKLVLEEVDKLVLAKKTAVKDDEGTVIEEDKILTIIEDQGEENAKVKFKKQSVVEGDKQGKDDYLVWLQTRKTQLESDLAVEIDEEEIARLIQEIADTDEAITAVTSQSSDFQTIIDSANKIN